MQKTLLKLFKLVLLIFGGAVGLGIVLATVFPNETGQTLAYFLDTYRHILQKKSFLGLWFFIFITNFKIALFAFLLGIITFGIYPLVIIWQNGQLLGMALVVFYSQLGIFKMMGGLLPHGVFELPAIWLSAALGLSGGQTFYYWLKRKKVKFKSQFYFLGAMFLKIVVPLLLLAAAIESYGIIRR